MLPAAFSAVAESDALRDECEEYAHKLIEGGVEVTAVRVLGTRYSIGAKSSIKRGANRTQLNLNAFKYFLTRYKTRGYT
jgi:acetyl esterase/lipase